MKRRTVAIIVGSVAVVACLVWACTEGPLRSPEAAFQDFTKAKDRAEDQLTDPLELAGPRVRPFVHAAVRSSRRDLASVLPKLERRLPPHPRATLRLSHKPLQRVWLPQGHRVESQRRLGGARTAERQGVRRLHKSWRDHPMPVTFRRATMGGR